MNSFLYKTRSDLLRLSTFIYLSLVYRRFSSSDKSLTKSIKSRHLNYFSKRTYRNVIISVVTKSSRGTLLLSSPEIDDENLYLDSLK